MQPNRSLARRFGNAWTLAHIAAIIVAIVMQFLPLTRELHYEFSAAMAVWLSFVVGLAASVRSHDAPMSRALGTTLPPLAIALIHSIASGFCGMLDGILWYAVLVLPSVVIACVVARIAVEVSHRRIVRTLAFIGLWSAPMIRGAYEALTGPHIFFYGWQVGFFPGGSWDPELPITPLLLVYRAAQIALAFVMLRVIEQISVLRMRRLDFHHYPEVFRHGFATAAIPGAIVAALVLALLPLRSEIGLTRTDDWLRAELGDSLRTRYTTIYYNAATTDSLDIWRAANLADFYVWRHEGALPGVASRIDHITLYAYASGNEQKRLVGTSSASFTKPWRSTLNISFDRIESTLEHELAHIVLARYGNVFDVSWSNGILEGSAVAFEHSDDPARLHVHAKAAYDFGLAPPVSSIMSATGFASRRSSLSYMLAGSFCRWLIDSLGARKFTDAYSSGSLDEHYGASIESLESRYRAFLNTLPKTDASQELAVRYLYGGGSFFLQRCLRRLATLTGDGYRAIAEERYDDALASFRASLNEGISSGARAGIIRALHGSGRYAELIDSMAQYERDTAGHWLLPYRIELSDALAMHRPNETRRRRELLVSVLASGIDEWTRMRAAVRIVFSDPLDTAMLAYFVRPMKPMARFLYLDNVERSYARAPASPDNLSRRWLLSRMKSALIVRQMPGAALAGLRAADEARFATHEADVAVGDTVDDNSAMVFAGRFGEWSHNDAVLMVARRGDDWHELEISGALHDGLWTELDPLIKAATAFAEVDRNANEYREFARYLDDHGAIDPWKSKSRGAR